MSFLKTLSPDTQALAQGFAEFLAERHEHSRTDSVAYLDKPLSPSSRSLVRVFATTANSFTTTRVPSFIRHSPTYVTTLPSRRCSLVSWSISTRGRRTLSTRYLKARNLIPVDTEVPSGADFYTYRMYDVATKALMLHNYAKNSFPEADVFADEFRQAIKAIGSKYSYSVQDMRAAAMSGVPLESKKASSARYGVEKRLEQIGAYGDAPTGLFGVTNAPGVAAVAKVSPAGTWAEQIAASLAGGTLTQTVQAILEDINFMANQIFTNTLGIHKPTTLVLPTSAYAILATTPRAPGFTNDTILQFIMSSNPWLEEIVDWPYLNTIGVYSLPGTFHATNSSASVTASVAQTGFLVPGDQITFTQDTSGAVYTVLTVAGTAITLTANYTGTTHTASPATKATGLALLYEKNPRVLNLVISQEFRTVPA